LEIELLMKAAYANFDEEVRISRGLGVVADALNQGDLTKASMAAVFLRLADLDVDDAVRMATANDLLAKYDPRQPRDWHGRWTESGANGEANSGASNSEAPEHSDLLTDVAYNGHFHNREVRELAQYFRALGNPVVTEVNFIAVNGFTARADMLALPASGGPLMLIKVKTGDQPKYTDGQRIVYVMAQIGGHVVSPDSKIKTLGLTPGEPLPPWYMSRFISAMSTPAIGGKNSPSPRRLRKTPSEKYFATDLGKAWYVEGSHVPKDLPAEFGPFFVRMRKADCCVEGFGRWITSGGARVGPPIGFTNLRSSRRMPGPRPSS
jgi:hypothetical protein